jgi:hypothetical protein
VDSSRAISLNGTITSITTGAAVSTTGSIYFYSPGGFVLGASSIINVGSLVLSASPILVSGGTFVNGANNTVVFNPANAGSSITTNVGSQITATNSDSYVAMVAPKVVHGGSINVSGSAALVGAEAATINFSPNGLFDIQVTAGTTDATGVSTSGTITGAASTGAADVHRAYLVAVPKNTALTMLIGAGSNLGFNVAGAANVVGNTVVLSAGRDISGGSIGAYSAGTTGGAVANLQVNDSNFTSAVNSESTGFSHYSAFAPMHFYSNVNAHADGEIWFSTQAAAGTIDVDGSLSLSTERYGNSGQSINASTVNLYNVNGGGRITVDGATTINTNAHGGWSGISGTPGGNATAGNVNVDATYGGIVELLGGLTVNANGYAGGAFAAGVNGGIGTGGNVNLYTIGDNSHFTITGASSLSANGYGGSGNGGECFSCNGSGGDGVGGLVGIGPDNATTTGSVMTFNGNVTGSANGYGGAAAGGVAGKGTGGSAKLLSGNLGTVTVNGSLSLQATGQGGIHQAGAGGEGQGGAAAISALAGATTGQVTITGNVGLDAGGTGGGAIGSATAGKGTGGSAYIRAVHDNVSITGNANLNATGVGGVSGTGTGGGGYGGDTYIQSDSVLAIGGLATLSTDGTGGNGNSGGSGTGGTTTVSTNSFGATLTVGGIDAAARGFGGDAFTNLGGAGSGGDIRLYYSNGTNITVNGDVILRGDGRGGFSVSGDGADGTGGYTRIGASLAGGSTGSLTISGGATMRARGFGGDTSAVGAYGGSGYGGTVSTGGAFGTMNVTGTLFGSALGAGGAAEQGIGGDGYGGSAWLRAVGATITVGSVDLNANGAGGDTSGTGLIHGTGGYGEGGYVELFSSSSLTVTGDANLHAAGLGGLGDIGGGDGYGGEAYVSADNGSLTVNGDALFVSWAFGGTADSGAGGEAYGGTTTINAKNNGNLRFKGDLTASAKAEGGIGATGGGDAHGGYVGIYSLAAFQVDGLLTAGAEGLGGGVYDTDTSGLEAADGFGGDIDVYAAGGILTVFDAVNLSTDGKGGEASGYLDISGYGEGGTTSLYANANGTVDFRYTLDATADGTGGDAMWASGAIGGDGKGGNVNVQATGANALVKVLSSAELSASAFEPGYGGGNGTGGKVHIDASGAPTASVHFSNGLGARANGDGGSGYYVPGGDGKGGEVWMKATDGSSITVDGGTLLSTNALGGWAYGYGEGDAIGGDGTGGEARIETFGTGGNITLNGLTILESHGWGGGAYYGSNTHGGTGTGGSALVKANPGTITIGAVGSGASLILSSNGRGGDAEAGIGGDGLGGTLAEIDAINGHITVDGRADVTADGYGGDGETGGFGRGSGITDQNGNVVGGANIFVRNGALDIGGGAYVSASGYGGDGGYDSGYGGDYGGDGGGGIGGWATISTQNSDLGPALITIDGLAELYADGIGGNGGDGASAAIGGNGGNGGNGVGGTAFVLATAGNGFVTIDDVIVRVRGVGGDGGDGGTGSNGAGGNGGNGGNGAGGFTNDGTNSGSSQAASTNSGIADFGTVTLDASAIGGKGGNGKFGATNGDGGDGGDAIAGSAVLLVRGSIVNVGAATLLANATGGNAGFGYVSEGGTPGTTGTGGDATVGANGIRVVASGRNLLPAQRGTLNAGTITGTAIATSGIGIPNGLSKNLGGSKVTFLDADGHIGSLDFLVGLGTNPSTSGVQSIAIKNGHVVVDGEFSFVTPGNLSLFADNGDMHAGILTLDAGNFTFDPVNDQPFIRGTYFADSATITTHNNFITSANLDIGSDLVIDAPGLINAQNFTIDGDLDLLAHGGNLTAINLDVSGMAHLSALGAISLNLVQSGFFRANAGTFFTSSNITSDSNIQIDAGGNVTLGQVVAGPTADINSNKAIRIISGGNVLAGNILAKGGIDITAFGTMTGGNVTTGDGLFTDAGGAIHYGNISAGLVNPQPPSEAFSVGLISGTSITIGNVAASQSVAFLSSGTLNTGNINTGGDLLGLIHGAINIGDINADGRVYLADFSMFTSAGGTIHGDNNLNPETFFAATPVATGGSIQVGDVVAGSFTAAAGTTLTTGTLNTDNGIELHGGGAITTDNITAGDFVLANGGSITVGNVDANSLTLTSTAGDITTGNVSASGDVEFDAFDDILAGNITAGGIDLAAGDNIVTGNLTTQQLVLLGFGGIHTLMFPGASVTLESGGDITTGDIDSFDGVYANAGGGIMTGTIDAGDFVQLLAVNNIKTGYIDAGDFIDIFTSTGEITTGNLNGTDISLDALGDIVFANVSGDEFNFETDGSVNGGSIGVTTRVSGEAGGTVQLGSISAGPNIPIDDFSVGIAAAGNINVGNVSGAGRVGFATLGNLTTGTLTGGNLVMTLVSGNTATEAITTSTNGRVYMADASMFLANGGPDDFDADAVLAATPVAEHGSLTINGNVFTNQFQAAAQGINITGYVDAFDGIYLDSTDNITTGLLHSDKLIRAQSLGSIQTGNVATESGAIDFFAAGNINTGTVRSGGNSSFRNQVGNIVLGAANVGGNLSAHAGDGNLTLGNATAGGAINGRAGGLITLNGVLNSGAITLTSADIDIASSGGINGGTNGLVTLESTNTHGMLVGDGLTGSGYALSNAEFGRISGGDIAIIAGGYAGAAGDTIVGDLTVTGPLAGSNIKSNGGGLTIATLSESGTELDGTLRIVGDVVATGFGADNYLSFQTEHFQLDAATGLVSITGNGAGLGGILELVATDIWVASGAILDKLEVNPKYSGYITELNSAAPVQRPDGVIRAAEIDLEGGDAGLQSILVQNTGTTALPAGFLVNAASIGDDGESAPPAGSIDLVINGQIIGESGTVTGLAVRDLLVTEFGTAPFIAGSTINGCPLVGACASPPPPKVDTVKPTDVQLTDNSGLGDLLFGNEPDIDDGQAGDEGDLSSPIEPPIPLFDSRPLTQTGDVDDPVSGAGNPSLYGNPSDEDCESEQDGKCKIGKKGDGK